ncbi:MAG: tripartite tricarboxylate transporter TctB family protein [Geminicoccales bacterium]
MKAVAVLTRKHAEWLVALFFSVVIAIVFYEIATSMTEQGIASGGPYDNAAAYPRAVAIIIGILIVLVLAMDRAPAGEGDALTIRDLRRPALLLLIFAIYLWALGYLGYHLATTPMLMAVMVLGGARSPVEIVAASASVAFGLAWFFEAFLKIVLPGGIFSLNVAW